MTALLTDEAALEAAKAYSLQRHPKIGHRNTEVWPTAENRNAAFNDFGEGARFARSIYEARLAEVSQLRDQYQGDLIKVNAALDGHANEIIRLTARLAEAILLMKEAAPAIDTISSGLSERFDRFLAIYTKEDKP